MQAVISSQPQKIILSFGRLYFFQVTYETLINEIKAQFQQRDLKRLWRSTYTKILKCI